MRSSVLSRTGAGVSSGGFHRPNVLSQVNHIFPNLDDILNENEKGMLRTQKVSNQSLKKGERLLSVQLDTIKPQAQEEVILWSASLSSTLDGRDTATAQRKQDIAFNPQQNADIIAIMKQESTPTKVKSQSMSLTLELNKRKARDISAGAGTKYAVIDIKEMKI
jgi:hypothetical protein